VDKLPQGILSLDPVSTQTFGQLRDKGVEVKMLPNPFLRRFRPSRLDSIPAEWRMPNAQGGFSKHILVSLTWGYDGEIEDLNGILDNGLFPKELAEVIDDRPEIFWHMRLHPVQMRSARYTALVARLEDFVSARLNTEWRRASSLPLPSIVAHCAGNITMSSMSSYDAAAMGVPSLFLCPSVREGGIYQDYFSDLLAEGYAVKEPISKESISRWILAVDQMSPRVGDLDDDIAWEDGICWLLESSGLLSTGRQSGRKLT
jgi:hypothetical protein